MTLLHLISILMSISGMAICSDDFRLVLRDYADNKPPYPLNSTLKIDRNYADICVFTIVQLYDVVIKDTNKSIYDYFVYLEVCDNKEPQNCTAISKAFPHCLSSSCFLGKNDSYHGAFSLRLDGNDDVIVLSLTLNKLLLQNDLYFSLVMNPKNEPDNKNTSTAFTVSADICEGALSVYGKSFPSPTSNPSSDDFRLILRDYTQKKPQYPLNSTLNIERNYADTCGVTIVQLYDVVIKDTNKSIYDYYVYLEECDKNESQNCKAISKAYPKCGLRCFLNNDDTYRDAFSLTLDGNDDIIVLSLTLNKTLLKRDLHFSLVVNPRLEPDNQSRSTAFIVSADICEGVLSVDSPGI